MRPAGHADLPTTASQFHPQACPHCSDTGVELLASHSATQTMRKRIRNSRKSFSNANDEKKDSELEKHNEIAEDVLESIQCCYKTCFCAFLSDIIITIIDDDIRFKLFGSVSSSLSWVDWVGVLDTCNLLIFGLGLMWVSRLCWCQCTDSLFPVV
jgi:hypothetical protein